jgi:alpha-L-fucosidase 2
MKLKHLPLIVTLLYTPSISLLHAAPENPTKNSEGLQLWYDKPAVDWEKEALPIGNGRLGAMVFGDPIKERIQFNEDSLWVGDEKDTGAYQPFGDLFIELSGIEAKAVGNYRRQLDLARAVHTVSYSAGGVNFQREYFVSHPAQVIVLRFTADKPGAYTGSVALTDAHQAAIHAVGTTLTSTGSLAGLTIEQTLGKWASDSFGDKNRPYEIGLNYEAQARLIVDGGEVEIREGKLFFRQANALTILLTAGTDFLQDRSKGWQGPLPNAANVERLSKAATTPYATLLAEHIQDYQSLFHRITLSLGASATETKALTTNKRLERYRQAKPYPGPVTVSPDPELEALMFQYGRYLMISSSRPGDLPANLQGVWNDKLQPAWRGDYHTDVNLQMNYWFVDRAALSECFTPMPEWLWSIIPLKREDPFKPKKSRGWGLTSLNGIFGGSGYHFVAGDAAWVAQNIWDHYAFTQDRQYLETRAYPILKELCEYWQDNLKESPAGKLIAPRSISPEHGAPAEGNAYEQQLIYDLFTNYLAAAKILDRDAEFRAQVENMRSRLLGPQVGSWGQLLEWSSELKRPEFIVSSRWEKNAEPVLAWIRSEAGKNAQSAAGVTWERFAPAIKERLIKNPKDFATLAEGLNALVQGPSLIDELAFSKSRSETLIDLHARREEGPLFDRWVNWCLLSSELKLRELSSGYEDTPLDTHRHTSQLIAVYPGRQISPETTPAFAKASGISLAARGESGDSAREWVWVWRAAIWARLANTDRAYRCVAGLLSYNVMPNLLQTHPPFQIDGSFGYAAAVGEMLLQCHEVDEEGNPVLRLLPALPKAWADGSVQGLRARGGLTVDIDWKSGKVTDYRITSMLPRRVNLRVNGESRIIESEKQ